VLVFRHRRGLAAAGAALSGFALAGCGAGLGAQTSLEHSVIQGSNADAGPIALRDVYLEPVPPTPPPRSPSPTAPVPGTTATPTPTATSSPTAPANRSAYLHAVLLNQGSTPDTLIGVSAGSATLTASNKSTSFALPPGRLVTFVDPKTGQRGISVRLSGLPAPVLPGAIFSVVFHFGSGASLAVSAPVFVNQATLATSSPIPLPTSSGVGSASP
jgi:hypothetical protein